MRHPSVFLLIGRNGAGKTTLARKLVSRFRANEVQVISPSGEWGEWESPPEPLVTRAVARGVRVLVLDDVDAYLASDSSYWRRLLSTQRHLGLDVLLLTRRPQGLPYWAVAVATTAYVFPVGPRETSWCRRMLGVEPPSSGHVPRIVRL
jgi:hypothetical protein